MNVFHTRRLGFILQAAPQGTSFGLAQDVTPITLWQGQGNNLIMTSGKLTLDGAPVAGVALRVDQYMVPATTAGDGTFQFLLDQTNLARRVLHVADAGSAQISDQAISPEQQEQVQNALTAVNVAFVMTLDQTPQLRQGDKDVQLSGRLTFSDKMTPVPPVALWDYIIRGVIRDAQGQPVANALASIAGEGGESSALSSPTDKTGQYTLRFFPEQANQYKVRVGYGQTLYTSAKPVHFMPGKSTEMDLVLPASGDELKGAGPGGILEPKEVDGAEYIGILTGLAAGDTPIGATLTWPDDHGAFTVTIPAVDFTGPVSFYQAQLRFFSVTKQSPGGMIAANVVPTVLGATMPRGLQPIPVAGA